jgi:hypothetical protein
MGLSNAFRLLSSQLKVEEKENLLLLLFILNEIIEYIINEVHV